MQKKNSNNNNNTSLLFNKKICNYNKTTCLKTNKNLGIVKHFSYINKEWINSIYSFNKNYIKHLPIKDNILIKIIKSYFNLFSFDKRSYVNLKNIHVKLKKLSILRIFVSKAEIKHTNTKAIITLYIYKKQKKYLFNKINNNIISNKLKERVELIETQNSRIFEQIEKEKILINSSNILQNTFNSYVNQYYKELIKKSLEKEIFTICTKQLLHFNKSKFEDTYLIRLNNIVKNIYSKNIEFNIINLKYIQLNSDIMVQSIILKLKRKKTHLLNILKKFFKTFKLSPLNKVILTQYFENNLNKKILYNINVFNKLNKDNLNQSLFNIFTLKNNNIGLETLLLNSLKYKNINGLRLEAKGRLSKRRTASKSVFKFKYKGSLKDLDSSYKGLSTTNTRGHIKSNMQYTMLNSKTRNGSFGIRGWISSK